MKLLKTGVWTLVFLLVGLTGCQDEDFPSMSAPEVPGDVNTTRAISASSALVQDLTTGYWKANKRVPLVGQGRVVNNIANELISVITTNDESSMGNLVDTDLSNPATLGENVAGVQPVANQIVSVRDLNRTYAGGQVVGFTYTMRDPGLLNVDLLKGFWIKTYKDGVSTGDYMIGGTDEDVKVLDLNLISTLNNENIQSLSFKTTQPFDEIAIGFSGVEANVLQVLGNLQLYYVFVGDNDIKPVYEGSSDFPNPSINNDMTTGLISITAGNLVDDDINNGVYLGELISGILDAIGSLLDITPSITVDLGKTVDAGSEIGFYMEGFSALELGLLSGIEFRTFDEGVNDDDDYLEKITVESKGLLGISAIKGGKSQMGITIKKPCSQIQIRFKGINISLGGNLIHYAYVRDKVEPDISSYFGATEVTISGNSYHLPKPIVGSVEWNAVLESPTGSSPAFDKANNKIVGMTVDGDYVLSGTYNIGSHAQTSENFAFTFVIHRVTPTLGTNCNQIIGENYGAEAYVPEGGGSLISTAHVNNIENVVNDNPNDYATFNKEISLADNIGIIGIKLGEGKEIVASEAQPMKVGFTIRTQGSFLDANILQFFHIKFFNNDIELDDKVVDESLTISADLIGSQGNKIRIGVTVKETFDRMELWSSGVLAVNLSEESRIYNAFFEDGSEEGGCAGYDASDACIEMLSTAHGAEINYKVTMIGGAATIGGSFNDLGNIIDDDKNSFATISDTELLGGTTVAVKFDEMPAYTQVGFIVTDRNFVLNNINVLSGTVMQVFHNGTSVGNSGETSSGDVLDLGLIGYTGKIYIEVTPTCPFDEVRLSFPTVLTGLDVLRINGAYVRRDSDNDGIPDCAEDDENPDGSLDEGKIKMSLDASDVCVGDEISISAQMGVGASTENLYLKLIPTKDSGQESLIKIKKVKIENSKIVLAEGGNLTMDNADIYSLRLYASEEDAKNDENQLSSEALILYVHPKETTWKGNSSSDWNDWDNWTDGSPWGCTNVTIPADCAYYPELEADGDNNCANIYIEHGGQVVHTQYLTYDQAWVDLTLDEERYYMLTSPLTDMVSGDWFVNATANESWSKFTALTNDNYPEDRLNPIVYQRLWSTNAPVKNPGGYANVANETEIAPDETQWTPPYNAVNQAYGLGQSFSLMAGKSKNGKKATFRFPKTHTEYNYYDLLGNPTGMKESVHNEGVVKGHFVDDGQWSNGTLTVTVKNGIENNVFLVGNPFVSHLDLKEFMTKNGISEVKLYDGNTYNPLILIDGQLVSLDSETSGYAKPMEAFFVTTNSKAASETFAFTSKMQTATSGTTSAQSRSGSVSASQMLRLTASVSGYDAQCLLRVSRKASEGVVSGEDTRLLIDGEAHPEVAVYTVADGEALDIQQIPAEVTRVPLGFYLRSGKGDVELRFDYTDRLWQGWSLLDTQSGERRSLANVINLKAEVHGMYW